MPLFAVVELAHALDMKISFISLEINAQCTGETDATLEAVTVHYSG